MEKLLIIVLMLTSLVGNGQSRENSTPLKFRSETGIVNKATGWSFNSTFEEWVDYENAINNNKDYKDRFKSLQGQYMMSKRNQNFIDIQMKTVVVDSVKYCVLIVKKWAGRYKYPSLKKDWESWKQYEGFIFEHSEYDLNLDSLVTVVELKTKKMASLSTQYKKYDDKSFLAIIQKTIREPAKSYLPEFVMPIKLASNDERFIRFHLPERFNKYGNYDFEKNYFELLASDFNVLKY